MEQEYTKKTFIRRTEAGRISMNTTLGLSGYPYGLLIVNF
jgi:hypothetical protein